MGLKDLFKPKWKHSNLKVRREAVEKLSTQDLLEEIAKNDKDSVIRITALRKLTNQKIIEELANNDESHNVRMSALDVIINQKTIERIAKNDTNWKVREYALNKINDPNLLMEIQKSDNDKRLRTKASILVGYLRYPFLKDLSDIQLENLANNLDPLQTEHFEILKFLNKHINVPRASYNAYKKIADRIRNDADILFLKDIDIVQDNRYREIAASHIIDQKILENIVKNDEVLSVRIAAIKNKNFRNQEILGDIAQNDEDQNKRIAAIEKLEDLQLLEEIAFNVKITDVRNRANDRRRDVVDKTIDQIKKIDDQKKLLEFATNSISNLIREEATGKILDENCLKEIAHKDVDNAVRVKAISKIYDQKFLEQIVLKDSVGYMKKAAIANLKTNSDVLISISQNDKDEWMRAEAVSKITDQNILIKILDNDKSTHVKSVAIGKITDKIRLAKYATNNKIPTLDSVYKRTLIDNIHENTAIKIYEDYINLRSLIITKINNPGILLNYIIDVINNKERIKREDLDKIMLKLKEHYKNGTFSVNEKLLISSLKGKTIIKRVNKGSKGKSTYHGAGTYGDYWDHQDSYTDLPAITFDL